VKHPLVDGLLVAASIGPLRRVRDGAVVVDVARRSAVAAAEGNGMSAAEAKRAGRAAADEAGRWVRHSDRATVAMAATVGREFLQVSRPTPRHRPPPSSSRR
jgi:hypothetical protein